MLPSRERYDVILIGGGIIGSSVAMGLAERGLKVAVVDIDLSGRLSSSEKNAGGVRATWWQPVNIALCRVSIGLYGTIRDEVGFRQKGYLWLYDAETWPKACDHIPLQRSLGHAIEMLTPEQVHQRVPEIDKLDGIAGATFSPADGLINPNLLKEYYRARSRAAGAEYLDHVYVHAAEVASDEVRLQCWQSERALSDPELIRMMTEDAKGEPPAGYLFELRAGAVAITTGAWSDNALKLFGLRNYSEPIRRQICLADNRVTNFAGEPFFVEQIWPRMYARMSVCERMRHVSGWAGLYEVSPDRSAIIGRAAPRVYEAHSFSGRGVMQSYGAGQALAELIASGSYDRFDAKALSRDRFSRNELAFEELHI